MRGYVIRAKVASGCAYSYAFNRDDGTTGTAHHWPHRFLPEIPAWAAHWKDRAMAQRFATALGKGTDVVYRPKRHE